MNKTIIFLTGVALTFALVFAVMPLPASADSDNAADSVWPAGLGVACSYPTGGELDVDLGGSYYGVGTRVTKENGNIYQTCAMQLVDGEPVTEVTKFTISYDAPYYLPPAMTCDFVATPGGTLNATCRFP